MFEEPVPVLRSVPVVAFGIVPLFVAEPRFVIDPELVIEPVSEAVPLLLVGSTLPVAGVVVVFNGADGFEFGMASGVAVVVPEVEGR